jgi:hypothetical protein
MTRPPPVTNQTLYRKCLDGHEPAESLPTLERQRLLLVLHNRGWSDTEIAVHCRMTLYTTARIRSRIGLSPNEAWKGVA